MVTDDTDSDKIKKKDKKKKGEDDEDDEEMVSSFTTGHVHKSTSGFFYKLGYQRGFPMLDNMLQLLITH